MSYLEEVEQLVWTNRTASDIGMAAKTAVPDLHPVAGAHSPVEDLLRS